MYVQFLIILLTGFFIAAFVHAIGKWLRRYTRNTGLKIDDIVLDAIGKPLLILITGSTIWSAVFYGTPLPGMYPDVFNPGYLTAFYVIIGAWVTASFITGIFRNYGRDVAIRTGQENGENMVHFLQMGSKYLIWIVAFLLILSILKIDVTPLLATGGLIGIIISLGGQDIIGNFLSGAVIAADQPFRIGDRIRVGDDIGDILTIGPRSTRIQTLDNQIITVPNMMLTNDVVVNYAMPDTKVKVRITIGVAYGSDIARVKAILHDIGQESQQAGLCVEDTEPEVYFLEFGPSSLNFQLIVSIQEYDKTFEVKDFINCRIDEEFKKANITIPFPQMDVHMV
jgi:small-conductance mechanosensitive channel